MRPITVLVEVGENKLNVCYLASNCNSHKLSLNQILDLVHPKSCISGPTLESSFFDITGFMLCREGNIRIGNIIQGFA